MIPDLLAALKTKLAAAVGLNGHTTEPPSPKPSAKRVEPSPPPDAPAATCVVSREELWRRCEAIATSASILDRFAADLRRSGVVGEDRTQNWFTLPLRAVGLDGQSRLL